jgi:hypothetical protein
MPERTPCKRQSVYRRSIKALATASLIGAACIAIAASGTPGDASANLGNPDPDIDAMNKAFDDYMKSVKNMQKEFLSAVTFGLDDAHAVGAYDLISSFLNSTNRSQLTASGSGRRGYPRFAGFDDPDTRIGVDNPDTQYMGTIVDNADCEGVWRIWGNRTNTADFILTTFDTASGQGGGPTLEDEDMIDVGGGQLMPGVPGEDFVVYAGCGDDPVIDDPDGAKYTWWDIQDIQTSQLQIARRQTACEWATEAPGEIHIERVGSRGEPSGPLDPAIMTEQILDGKAILDVQGPFWPAFVDSIRENIPVNTATPWRPTGGLGITTQLSMLMWYDLEDDEALIIRLPDEGYAKYYGLQLSNFWGSSADWANRHVSMNWGLGGECQAELSQPTFHPAQQQILATGGGLCGVQGKQDAYFIVLSKQDPGVQNWIETAEMSQGLIAGRLQSVNPADVPDIIGENGELTCALPVAIKVPVAAVKAVLGRLPTDDPPGLGASFTNYNDMDRADQLEIRQDYARSKYVFW